MKPDLATDRLTIALLIGAGAGFLMGRFFGNYPVWIIVFCAFAIAIETSTRVRQDSKKIERLQDQALKKYILRLKGPSSIKFRPPKLPKPPKTF